MEHEVRDWMEMVVGWCWLVMAVGWCWKGNCPRVFWCGLRLFFVHILIISIHFYCFFCLFVLTHCISILTLSHATETHSVIIYLVTYIRLSILNSPQMLLSH